MIMAELNIPTEIKDIKAFPQLKKIDRQIICAAVLMGLQNQEAFKLFHPEFLDDNGKLNETGKKASSMFWNYGKNKDYREQYEKEVEESIGRGSDAVVYEDAEDIDGDALARKILSDLAAMIKNGRIQDYEVLKIATDILNKYGVLKGSEEKVLPPIRILPARCGECRYKAFVESAVAAKEVLDCCAYCKARKVAENAGYRFNDGKDLLDIPENVAKELECENNVQLTDILSGKIKN